ncbi:MAG TPA: 5-oxoprolinase/urea amidolyase family protein [Opitutales bacterium]|nr:5-oxoprolinase/urea amidolyase family protein [Opitutales bacterium]
MKVALKAYGETGILACALNEKQRAGLCRALLGKKPGGCLEYVEGFDSVLFVFERPTSVEALAKWLRSIPAAKPEKKKRIIDVPVVYNGPDLKEVAKQTGLGAGEVIQLHSDPIYTVRMSGFTPGFPYLDGLDERLHLPRKKSPRKRIKAGSVAIGGSHAGIYSVGSPGGWHLLGHTELELFNPTGAKGANPDPERIFRFAPGDRLRFRAVEAGRSRKGRDVGGRQLSDREKPAGGGTPTIPCLKVVSPGSGLSLQDAGRGGWLRYGVPRGGAIDRRAMRAANKLLGNRPNAPVLEILLQGAKLKVLQDTWIALAGADSCPALPARTAREFKAGEVIEFAAKADGLFAYLAVPGGFAADRWFGSVSVDLRNGLGKAVKRGDELISGKKKPNASTEGVARRLLGEEEGGVHGPEHTFQLLPGPQFEAFSRKARETLVKSDWIVSDQSDRTGYRLEGPKLEVPDAIPSEPVLPGSFQVPGRGLPIVTMVDGPTVGGYPKIAVLQDADRDRLAQCAPGSKLRFQWAES